jgi:ubiquinone/menaquinone biosynthesis C-methylase UbiE
MFRSWRRDIGGVVPTIDWNLKVWDKSYDWRLHGDEWDDFARHNGIPYDSWKDQLRRVFIVPHVTPSATALEIGPGHGRWSALLQPKVKTLHLVDLSPSCIDYCRKRLAEYKNVQYHVNDGKSLGMLEAVSVDFVWSFDTFVHIEEPEVRAYTRELRRVMKPQSMGVIHHPGAPTPQQRQNGCRSQLDSRKFAAILAENSLHVIRQVSEWGNGCNMALTGDALTVFARP